MDKPLEFEPYKEITDGDLTFRIYTFFDQASNSYARVTSVKSTVFVKGRTPSLSLKAERMDGVDAIGSPRWVETSDYVTEARLTCLALLWADTLRGA